LKRDVLGCCTITILLACGGATADQPAGGDASTLRTCTIVAGTYTETFALGAGGLHCSSVERRTITIAGNEAITGMEVNGGGFGLFDGGPGCTDAANSNTCTFTSTCTTTANGSSSQVSVSLTFDGDSAAGEESTKATDSTGEVLSSCNYDVTMTMTD
jgi:hypothetical protein